MQTLTPPQATEIEIDVLCLLISKPSLLTEVEDALTPECFYDTTHFGIFSCIYELHMKGEFTGFPSLIRELHLKGYSKDHSKLAATIRGGYASELDFHGNVNLLSDLWIKRQLLTGSLQMQTAIERQEPLEAITAQANTMADVAIGQTRQIKGIHFSDSVDELAALLDQPKKGGLSGVNTGIGKVNGFTDGWQSSDVVVIGARPGMGKTAVALHHTYHAALSGVPVAFVSLEMPKWGLTARIVSNLTSIEYGSIMKRDLVAAQKEAVLKKANEISKYPIYYYDYKNSWDINDIALTMRSWKRKYGIGLIFIDYIQLVRDKTIKNASDETAIVNSVSRKTKQLQSQLDIPIIELAQLSREVEKKGNRRPGLSDLKQSGQLEQDASTVIFLYRDDYYRRKEDEANKAEHIPNNEIEYIFEKNRNGQNGSITLGCKIQYNQVYDLDESRYNGGFDNNYARNEVFSRAGLQAAF